MGKDAVKQLQAFGQSPWLDFIRRGFIADGSLARLVAEDGLGGVTSNPAIFEKALAAGADYQDEFVALTEGGQHEVGTIYETIAVEDIRHAADVLRPVFDATGGRDGFVSLEVSPYLALDEAGSVAEARRLWAWVDRPNLMVKVPGTRQCVPAIRTLIADGININVTLLFSQAAYQAVAEAFVAGLEDRQASGRAVNGINSVASFFVSRIDAVIDKEIDRRVAAGDAESAALKAVRGKTAIANAKLAYEWYQAFSKSDRWQRLAKAGAAPQRLLWASTGTKDAAYSDVLYVEELIGPETVNTMPPATLEAFRDHGVPRQSLTENLEAAKHVLAEVERLGLDLAKVTDGLVVDGVKLFAEAFDKLLGAVAAKRSTLLGAALALPQFHLPPALDKDVAALRETWRHDGNIRRLWQHDASLFTNGPEASWLGWLGIVDERLQNIAPLLAFQADIKSAGFTDILLLGMGGSSLGPEVLARTFGAQKGWPALHVLDSTDPQQISAFESRVDLAKTLVIVSSKSGGTLEPNILKAYFFARMSEAVGAAQAGKHFVAVTDPGSHMQKVAEADGFRYVFFGDPSIGGRFSVLSNFGLVPAAAAGLDVRAFLESAARMVRACGAAVPPAENPGVQLGTVLGAAHAQGHDKLTLIASPAIASLGGWLEQLVAESTGKLGQAIIPINGETVLPPGAYGKDRLFAYISLAGAEDKAQGKAVEALEQAGQPVVRVVLHSTEQIAQQFFLWEIATAVAGSVMGIDPFDQPDVEASKIKTRALTDAYNKTGALPAESPFASFGAFHLFADDANAAALHADSLVATLQAHFARIGAGDYAGILAYVEQNPAHTATLAAARDAIGAKAGVATTLQFGPRFLHSTGQAYKGGPNSGVFLQVTADDAHDVQVPGERYTFGIAKAAQARGDFGVLAERGRRALRVHITGGLNDGLARLAEAVKEAVK